MDIGLGDLGFIEVLSENGRGLCKYLVVLYIDFFICYSGRMNDVKLLVRGCVFRYLFLWLMNFMINIFIY